MNAHAHNVVLASMRFGLVAVAGVLAHATIVISVHNLTTSQAAGWWPPALGGTAIALLLIARTMKDRS